MRQRAKLPALRSGGRSDGYIQTDGNVGGGVNQPRTAYGTGLNSRSTEKEPDEDDRQKTPHFRHNSKDKQVGNYEDKRLAQVCP